MTPGRLLAVDGNSILNRAYYGVRPLTTRDGETTHAVFGFLRILQKVLDEYNPEGFCVTFDLPGPTFRHEMYEGYKAGRKPMPDDLAAQLGITKQVLGALRVPVYELSGYEADDVLGTLSRVSAEKEWTCIILTGDRDSYQLIGAHVQVLRSGGKEEKLYTLDTIREEYGLAPRQMIDLKALQGDASDQIPGVAGIGEKSALTLIQEYESLDKLYENLETVPEKFRKKLEPGREMAYLSRTLGEINQNVPLYFDPEQTRRRKPDCPALRELFRRLEFSNKMLDVWCPPEVTTFSGENLSFFAQEAELPEGVGRNIKTVWREELARGESLTPYRYDAAIAAWMLGQPEAPWEDMAKAMKEQNLWRLFEETEMPLCRVLAEMEHTGIMADRNRLSEYKQMLEEQMEGLEQDIYRLGGCHFNILSPKQLGELLFGVLCLPHGKKTKTGWSTDADTLEGLRGIHPIVPAVLEYRTLAKLKSTYADGLLRVMDNTDRIHSTFQMTATVTGRLSSTEPNLQNIPVRQELGAQLREMFIAPPGWVLVDADYSQIELRVLAHIAGDEVMRNAFRNGEDIHTVTASQVFGIPPGEVTPLQRRHAKAVNFGIVYGISDFSLSNDIGVSRAEAGEYIRGYLEKYAGVRQYMTEIVEAAHRDGYVTTLFGRRRAIPEIHSRNHNIRKFGERAALNAPIQGSAADIIKMAMAAVFRRLKEEALQARLVLQVHDELIVECPQSEAEQVKKLLQEEMENVFPLDPPLVAEAYAGKSWATAKG